MNPSALNMNSGGGSVNSTNAGIKMVGDAKNSKNWLRNDFGTVIRDFRGRPITKGKRVAYAVRSSTRAYLKIGKVVGLTENGKIEVINENKKKVFLNYTDRMVAIS